MSIKYTEKLINGRVFYTNPPGSKNNTDADQKVLAWMRSHQKKEEFIIAHCVMTPEQKIFSSYTKVIREDLSKMLKKDNQLYEIMSADRPQKLAFDIDLIAYPEDDPLDKVKTTILRYFPGALMNISGCEKTLPDGKVKFSYHIIVQNYFAKCSNDLVAVKDFCCIPTNRAIGFDPNLYKSNGLIKSINQSKGDNRVQKKISGSKVLLDHTVMHNIPSGAIDVTTLDLPRNTIPKRKNDGTLKKNQKKIKLEHVIDFPTMKIPPPEGFDIYESDPSTLLANLPNHPRNHIWRLSHNICCRVARWCKQVGIQFEEFWEWNKQKDDSSERRQKYYTYWETHTFPVSENLVKTYMLHYVFNGDLLKAEPVRRMINSYNVNFDYKTTERYVKASDYANAETYKHVGLHVPLGGAKTVSTMTKLRDDIKKYPNLRILWATCLIALAKSQRNKIEHLTECDQWKYYDDLSHSDKMNKNRVPEQYFVCSVQSIQCLRGFYDVIVMDECETLLKAFDKENDTMRELKLKWDIFINVINNAKRAIYLDGFLTNITKNFVDGMGDRLYVIGSDIKPKKRKMVLCEKLDYIYHDVFAELEKGKKIFIGVGAKGKNKPMQEGSVEHLTSTILKRFPDWKRGIQLLAYHGETDTEKKKLEKNVNNIWGNQDVRVVIGNAALAVGIDFSPDEEALTAGTIRQFDKVFGILNPTCISMRNFFQLLFRIRAPLNDTFTVHFGKSFSSGWSKDTSSERILPTDPIYETLQKNILQERRADHSIANKQLFRKFCEWMNITLDDEDVLALTEEEFTKIHDSYDGSMNMFAFENIPDLTEEEFFQLQKKMQAININAEELLQLEKYRFIRIFIEGVDHSFFWNNLRMQTYAMNMLLKVELGKQVHSQSARLMYQFFKDNNLDYEDAIPTNAICKTPFKDIAKAFGFHNVPISYRMDLFAKMINIYFQKKLISKDYSKRSKTGAKYTWVQEKLNIKNSLQLSHAADWMMKPDSDNEED